MTMIVSSDRNLSGLKRWFSRWVQRRADKNRRFRLPQFLLTRDLLQSHPRRRHADREAARCLADVPEHLRDDLGLDGGLRMRSGTLLGSSQMYYDRIIGSADRG